MRSIAGYCALLALTVSFAESVWVATCAMPMTGGTAEAHEAASDIPSDTHCVTHWGHDPERDGPDDQPCPFDSGVAAQVCAGVVSLPATTAVFPALASEAAGGLFILESWPGLLPEGSLFRPPRA